MTNTWLRRFLWIVLVVGVAPGVRAQQRPLTTQDPEVVGTGQVLVETGFDYAWDQVFPASGLEGNLLRVPLVGAVVGLSSLAEVQITGGLYNRMAIVERHAAPLGYMLQVPGDTTSDVEDIVVATKVRILGETRSRPAIGLRLATRLPNAGNESGLGLDTTDFYATGLIGKTFKSTRVAGNIGVGILPDPTRGDRQNDVLVYGVSLARAISEAIDVVGELSGRASTRSGEPPPGTESREVMRIGARYTRKAIRFDGAVLFGMTTRDPTFGVSAGFTYIFTAFHLP
jgi:hypothetical protein